MERALKWLLATGYPQQGIDWFRRHRLAIILALALAAWLPLLGLVALVWRLLPAGS